MSQLPSKLGAAALVLLAVLLIGAGCGDDDDEQPTANAADSGEKSLQIDVVSLGLVGDSFWNVVRKGALDAGEDLGVEVNYQGTQRTDFTEQAKLIEASAAGNPDGLVVTNHQGSTLNPPIIDAIESGIPTMIINAGAAEVAKTGALGFVGQDDFEVGKLAGERLQEAGATNILCINQLVGEPALDARCEGLEAGFGGKTKVLGVDGEDPTGVENAVRAALQRDSSVDGFFGLGQTATEPALAGAKASGREDELSMATADLSPGILRAVEAEELLFAVDQQQYLQGYLGVLSVVQYVRYGLDPADFIPSGPALILPETAGEVIELSEDSIR
jgi:simple sugar transport system substrate-binding protein